MRYGTTKTILTDLMWCQSQIDQSLENSDYEMEGETRATQRWLRNHRGKASSQSAHVGFEGNHRTKATIVTDISKTLFSTHWRRALPEQCNGLDGCIGRRPQATDHRASDAWQPRISEGDKKFLRGFILARKGGRTFNSLNTSPRAVDLGKFVTYEPELVLDVFPRVTFLTFGAMHICKRIGSSVSKSLPLGQWINTGVVVEALA
ncbi:hypothetical protein EVAR_65250_1 [Eumeta japonica]|uniref:Uncharacterized protein n=1 Tax=Eumeta variegata TaxID=151549 RepID=A0A4C1ZU17_EUMVA|nr:hypothetical protein EVAR_65250_1 [Eumeta japonica]